MICPSCNNEQAQGKFCGKCGTEMNPTESNNVSSSESYASSSNEQSNRGTGQYNSPQNERVENIKKESKIYWRFFLNNLKSPSKSLDGNSKDFLYGIISIILFAALVPITLYPLISEYSILDYLNISFISIFINLVIFVLVLSLVVLFSLFIVNKFFGPNLTFNEIIVTFGSHLSRSMVGLVLAFLLFLLKSNVYGILVLNIVFIFTLIVMPIYLISALLTKRSDKLDPYDGFIIYIVIATVLFAIITSIFIDSSVGRFLDQIFYYF